MKNSKTIEDKIQGWLDSGERFDGRSIGNGLYLRFRKTDVTPTWRFRYRFAGKARIMLIGSYDEMTLSAAKQQAKEYSARVTLGNDVAFEKKQRKADTLAKIDAEKNIQTVNQLTDKYYARRVEGRVKHPHIVRSQIERCIRPYIGKLRVENVTPNHIDDILVELAKKGTPTVANKALRLLKRIFNFAITRQLIKFNPASAFEISDAGGLENSRERTLSENELIVFFEAMRNARGLSIQNQLTFKLLLVLAVRKMELCTARWEDFNFDLGIWSLGLNKTSSPIEIPLVPIAIEWLLELKRLSCGSKWVLPARKMQDRMLPHICDSTLSVALGKVKHELPHFTIHDLRRTARTHLSRMTTPDIAEACLNHKLKGMKGVYDRYTYFDERKKALAQLATFIVNCEKGNVVQFKRVRI